MHPRKALAIAAGLSASLFVQTTPSQAAAPPEPLADRASPITPQTMLNLFLAANPAARTDAAFVRDWIVTTKCTAWTAIHDDEFRAGPFLKAGAAEFAANREASAAVYELRLDRNIDRYDAGKGEFGPAHRRRRRRAPGQDRRLPRRGADRQLLPSGLRPDVRRLSRGIPGDVRQPASGGRPSDAAGRGGGVRAVPDQPTREPRHAGERRPQSPADPGAGAPRSRRVPVRAA